MCMTCDITEQPIVCIIIEEIMCYQEVFSVDITVHF